MVYINEWLPNPSGNEAQNEWIELYNDSNSSVNISGWSIVSGNKTYQIKNKILNPKEYLILKRTETKIPLLNQNGELKLLDANKNIIQKINFFGQAPENKSFSRFNNDFFFTEPTPVKENKQVFMAQIVKNYPENLVLNKLISTNEIIFFGILTGILLSLIMWIIIKSNENLKELFF
jgi:hypothetical protein